MESLGVAVMLFLTEQVLAWFSSSPLERLVFLKCHLELQAANFQGVWLVIFIAFFSLLVKMFSFQMHIPTCICPTYVYTPFSSLAGKKKS